MDLSYRSQRSSTQYDSIFLFEIEINSNISVEFHQDKPNIYKNHYNILVVRRILKSESNNNWDLKYLIKNPLESL